VPRHNPAARAFENFDRKSDTGVGEIGVAAGEDLGWPPQRLHAVRALCFTTARIRSLRSGGSVYAVCCPLQHEQSERHAALALRDDENFSRVGVRGGPARALRLQVALREYASAASRRALPRLRSVGHFPRLRAACGRGRPLP
jgi:hypothetical protein